MKTTRLFRFGLLLLWLGLLTSVHAEDTDIYSQNAANTGVPNVLLVLDNAANFSSSAGNCTYVDGTAPSLNGTAGGIEQCAIYNVVSGLPAGAINLGMMVYNDNNMRDIYGANCGGANGGCLTVPLTLMSGTAKTNFLAWVKSWRTSGGAGLGYMKASGEATAATMQEAWAYYAGQTGLSGRNYAAVQPPAGCQKNFLIFIGNAFNTSGTPGDGGSTSPSAALTAAPGFTALALTPDPIIIPSGSYGPDSGAFSCGSYTMPKHTDSSGLFADEWARYMHKTDLYGSYSEMQVITSYTIGLLGPQCKPDFPALLKSIADPANGGGKYFATSNYDEISTAILKILNEVQAVNSVFASASLPVSVNATGTYLNQIYLGMFRPDATGNPRWLGNLKQYQFILQYNDPANPNPNNATLALGDALSNPALSSAGTGFLAPTAQSFWTYKDTTKAPDSTGGFFLNDSKGVGATYDLPDGELVEKGGVAQQVRNTYLTVNYSTSPSTPRNLYTYCPGGSGCVASLTDVSNQFATTNAAITDAMLSSTKTVGVTSLRRLGGTVTVTTGVPHGFATGDTVIVSGADQNDYNGTKSLITVLNSTQFTYGVTENPPSPSLNANGNYGASAPGNPLTITSLSLGNISGTTATVYASTYPAAHGFIPNQYVLIGASNPPQSETRYSGSFPVTVTGASTFTYTITTGPASPAGGGTVTVASGAQYSIDSVANSGVTRNGTIATVNSPARSDFKRGNTCAIAAGNNVTIGGVTDSSGAQPAQYNITTTSANGGVLSVNNNCTSFTYAVAMAPSSPAKATFTADGSASQLPLTGLTHGTSTATLTATATATVPGNQFVNGQSITIGLLPNGVQGTNENAYLLSAAISNVNSAAGTFDYTITTTPASPATGNIVVSKAGVSDRTSLINWVRGENNFGDEPNPGFGYTVRESVHGDVLHSRPAVINYGDSRGLVLFYGDNQGVFRAVNGDKTAPIGSVQAGGELWGLILPEHFAKLARQRANDPELKFPSTALTSARPKDYFVDGLTSSYLQYDANNAISRAYIYLTMRRGGNFIYAIDVTTPTAPTVLWKINTATAGFGELGQTWSRPRLTLVKGYADASGNAKPVLVFGAGYDAANEDVEPPTADGAGRGIYAIDAATGALIWRATSANDTSACPSGATCTSVSGMNWAVTADVSFLDRDNDGLIDRLYASDVGGNIWRVDLEAVSSGLPATWQVTKLAALGCATGACASGTSPRKFFFAPSVVTVGATGATGSYDAVMLGSGDREHPLTSTNASSSYFVTNRFYMLKDTQTGKDANSPTTWVTLTEASLFNATPTTFDTTSWTFVPKPYPGTGGGFYISLMGYDGGDPKATPLVLPAAHYGEKAVNEPLTSRGTTYFGTNRPIPPSPNSCSSNLGEAKSYAINPFTGVFSTSIFDGGGMPPSPVAGVVTMALPDGTPFNQSFCIGCGGSTALSPVDPSKKVPKKPRRAYWYKQ